MGIPAPEKPHGTDSPGTPTRLPGLVLRPITAFDPSSESTSTRESPSVMVSSSNRHAGAGVVYDSVPQTEFEETQNKLRALAAAVGVRL